MIYKKTMEAIVGVLSTIGTVYSVAKKISYKLNKKKIYKHIRKAITELDYENIVNGVEKLKLFDIKNIDTNTMMPKKKFFENLTCRQRLPKMEKFEELFGFKKEHLETIESFMSYLNDTKTDENTKLHELQIIKEDEISELVAKKTKNEQIVKLKESLMVELKKDRDIIDGLNLTKILEPLMYCVTNSLVPGTSKIYVD